VRGGPQHFLTQLILDLPGLPEAELNGCLPGEWKGLGAARERMNRVG
jgi:hypothetical protein